MAYVARPGRRLDRRRRRRRARGPGGQLAEGGVDFAHARRPAVGQVDRLAAVAVAIERLREPGDDRARLARLWMRVTGQPADEARVSMLAEALSAERLRWGGTGTADAQKLVDVGEAPARPGLPAPEVAAWTMVAHAILASDGAIVKD